MNILNIKHLVYFKELARTEHMSQAAENLGISEPSLSYAIKKLEVELGVPLFEPDGRNIKLTHLGGLYLKYITASINSLNHGNDLIKQLMNPNKGYVKLGFTYTLGQSLVPELIKQFSIQENNREISFELNQSFTAQLLRDLYDEKYDVILSSDVTQFGDQDPHKIFNFTPIVEQEIKLAVPFDHPLAQEAEVRMADIGDQPLIMYSKNSGLRPLINQILERADIQPNIKFEMVDDHSIVGFVRQGLGIALVPNLPQLNQEFVKLKPIVDNPVNHELFLVTKQSQFITPSVSRFQEFVKSYCWQHYTNKDRLI